MSTTHPAIVATEIHRLAMFAWCADREAATRGHLGGSDERTWRETHPAPRFRDALEHVTRDRRELADKLAHPDPLTPRATNVVDLTDWIAS